MYVRNIKKCKVYFDVTMRVFLNCNHITEYSRCTRDAGYMPSVGNLGLKTKTVFIQVY